MAFACSESTQTPALPGMDEALFARWARLLEARTGVVVPEARKAFLVSAVRARMREIGLADFESYFERVNSGPRGRMEWSILVDRLTVHETRFFRHVPSLQAIAEHWLPARMQREPRNLHAWSIGCASGEEAWTLAMVLHRKLSMLKAPENCFGVTASDVSQAALALARAGVYPGSRLSEVPPEYRASYVQTLTPDGFTFSAALRRRVGFVLLNVLESMPATLRDLDLVYCQNVLIYFSRERRHALLSAIADTLRPGGLLVLGMGEVTGFEDSRLVRLAVPGTLAYLRNV